MPITRRSAAALLVAASLLLAACGGDKKDEGGGVSGPDGQTPTSAGAATASPDGTTAAATAADPAGTATASGFPEPKEGVLLAKLIVPAAKVNHAVEVQGVNDKGEMELPSGKDGIAWYDFSAFPGYGSNAVFSGHLDWFTGELGVFGRMRDLKEGDEASVELSDGMVMKYKVAKINTYEVKDLNQDRIAEITGPTDKDMLTFITCDGAFRGGDYTQRRVIRAERIA